MPCKLCAKEIWQDKNKKWQRKKVGAAPAGAFSFYTLTLFQSAHSLLLELVKKFKVNTGCTQDDLATFFLEAAGWHLEVRLSYLFPPVC